MIDEPKGDSLITEMRETFTEHSNEWKDNKDEGNKDMKYISGDPWDGKERAERTANNRPCIATDELNQYTDQIINTVRESKRTAKIAPLGNGANDKTAQFLGSMIRGIEYDSNAQYAYITGFENAVRRSYGFWRVIKEYVGKKSFDQKLIVQRIPNPNSVIMDPYGVKADGEDMRSCFIVDRIRKTKFKKDWPKAKVIDFTLEEFSGADKWFEQEMIQVAEWWKVDTVFKTLVMFETDGGTRTELLEDIGGKINGSNVEIKDDRRSYPLMKVRQRVPDNQVKQYFTNGFEILEETEWEGDSIPVIQTIGKELYLEEGGQTKRKLHSLIRLARDPYMLYCYYRTCEAEVVSMTPKTPFVGAVGQFKTDIEAWQNVNTVPRAFLQYDVITDAATGAPLPPPSRPQYEPQIQPLEMGAEAMKRQIQSSIGMFNTSVGRADTKASSGVAIRALDQQSDQGTFHFIDNYDMALKRTYKILLGMIPFVYDTGRQVLLVDKKGEVSNPITTMDDQGNVVEHSGEHDCTVDTGPSYQSQRDEVDAFLDQLAKIPNMFAQVADLIVKSKNMGPMGEEIADRLTLPQYKNQDGKNPMPPEAQQALAQAKQQMMALNAHAQQLEGKLNQLMQEKQARIVDNQFRQAIAAMQEQTKLAVAWIKAKQEEGKTLGEQEWNELEMMHKSAHDAGMAAMQNAHTQMNTLLAAQQQPDQGQPDQSAAQ